MTTISGNTYPVRQQLAALGGKWDPTAKSWTVPDEKADQARAIVASAGPKPSNTNRTTSSPSKRCWECGRSFTFADSRRNGGDWSDSYCGC